MTRLLFDDVVRTDYGQLDVVWNADGGFDGDWDRFYANQVNGLVGAADRSGVHINLARRSGGSRVQIVLEDDVPPPPPPRYEDVVEVSIVVPQGADVGWQTWAGETWGTLDGLPSGSYRLRVSAHGRDAGANGEFEPTVVDVYLVELWPSPLAPDEIVRVGSNDAQYWHSEVGGRR